MKTKLQLLMILLFFSGCALWPQHQNRSKQKTPEELSELYTGMGTNDLVLGNFPGAIESLRKALEFDSQNSIAHNHLGLAYLQMQHPVEAKKEFERALSINPNYGDALINVGTWHFNKREYDMATHFYKKTLNILEYKSRHIPLTTLGHVALVKNNNKEAKQYLFEAIADNPSYCLAHMLLGELYRREENFEKAAGEFKQSIHGDCAKNVEGRYQLGLAYTKLRQFSKARENFSYIIENYPNHYFSELSQKNLHNLP